MERPNSLWFSCGECCLSASWLSPTVENQSGTLIFLHGRFEDHRMWEPLWQGLSSRLAQFAFDLPGFGNSYLARDYGFSLGEHTALVLEILRYLQNDSQQAIYIVGHDLGAYIAAAAALQAGASIKGLILINPFPQTKSASGFEIGWRGWRIRKSLRRLFEESAGFIAGFSPSIFKEWSNQLHRSELRFAYAAIEDSWPIDFVPVLTPTLVLTGRMDSLNSPPRVSRLVQDCFPNAEFYIHEKAGHWPCLEDPAWVVDKIESFLFRLLLTTRPESRRRKTA